MKIVKPPNKAKVAKAQWKLGKAVEHSTGTAKFSAKANLTKDPWKDTFWRDVDKKAAKDAGKAFDAALHAKYPKLK